MLVLICIVILLDSIKSFDLSVTERHVEKFDCTLTFVFQYLVNFKASIE